MLSDSIQTKIPDEVQHLIASQSFAVAYKMSKYQLAGHLRSKNPVALEFLFRISDVQRRVTIVFDGHWSIDDDSSSY